jgi:hypothetical protein
MRKITNQTTSAHHHNHHQKQTKTKESLEAGQLQKNNVKHCAYNFAKSNLKQASS